jgi:digeranylgeranylglycerophospholipid reductase
MTVRTEVIIIGAGPAGLIAAKNLAESHIEYLLIDRDEKPGTTKPCGGFIPSSTLERFMVPRIEGQHRIDAVRMKFPGMEVSSIQFDAPLGVNVSRAALAKALLNEILGIREQSMLGTSVERIETDTEWCRVTVMKDGNKTILESRLVIDASGANPVSQRFLPLREKISNSQMGYGLQYHVEVEKELEGSNTFLYGSEFSPGGYCWIFPRGNIAVVGTGGLVKNVRENERRPHEYLDSLLKEEEPFRSELAGGKIIKKDSALMPLCGVIRPSYGKRIILVGDAAGHCSPISGEGIHYSMVGGQCAALTATECIKRNQFSDSMLSNYEKRWIREMGSDLKWGLWLQRKLLQPGSGKAGGWSSSGFINSKKSQRIIAEMLMGRRSVRGAIMSIAPSYLKAKVINK